MQKDDSSRQSYDWALIGIAAILTFIGLVEIYAASSMKAAEHFNDQFFFLRKQTFVALLGFAGIIVLRYIPFKLIERLTLPLVGLSIVLLALILVPGLYIKVKGASRWINLFGLRFQPAELAKLAMILFLAKNLCRKQSDLRKWTSLLPNMIIFFVFASFLMLQPDFGTTALIGSIVIAMLFVAGLARKYLVILAGLALGLVGVAIAIAPYRLKRLISFIDPWAVVDEGGFQIIQSYLAFQNGGLFGLGLGESRQKLFFLPEAHSDFILAVIGEEIGLLGVVLVCACFFSMVFLGFKVTGQQKSPYKKFLSFGLTSLIAIQSLFNIGVVMGLLPTKGIPLPFVSSGASSLLVFLVVIGILARLGREANDHQQAQFKKPV